MSHTYLTPTPSPTTSSADVTGDQVLSNLYFNFIVFLILITLYEIVRRCLPSIYSSRDDRHRRTFYSSTPSHHRPTTTTMIPPLPTGYNPFKWIILVWNISWDTIHDVCGLDAYFFLRYISLCLKLSSVSGAWGFLVLWPVFATGGGGATGLYYFSMSNLEQGSWRLWFPCLFMWAFSGYVFYVIDKELQHYIERRMDFLGKGDPDITPQNQYSLMIEQIPYELRSSKALQEYFNSLYPGKVHSASAVINLPELESLSSDRSRITRRLEKAIAHHAALHTRTTNVIGRRRIRCCGIESEPHYSCRGCLTCRCWCCCPSPPVYDYDDPPLIENEDGVMVVREPQWGETIDSIQYYSRELKMANEKMVIMQEKKMSIADKGNKDFNARNWFRRVVDVGRSGVEAVVGMGLQGVVVQQQQSIDDDDDDDNKAEEQGRGVGVDQSSKSARFEVDKDTTAATTTCSRSTADDYDSCCDDEKEQPLLENDYLETNNVETTTTTKEEEEKESTKTIFSSILGRGDDSYKGRIIGNTGLDFIIDTLNYVNDNIDQYVEDIIGISMSSTGFVTFMDLSTTTSAAAVQLTHQPRILMTWKAPEPRDLIWKNVHVDHLRSETAKSVATILIGLGAVLWSVPVTLIQAVANAETLAGVPGLEWIDNIKGGEFANFINGYLPVLALLGLMMLLPMIFEWIAIHYEKRKTYSGVALIVLCRYFYYQIANIYVTVTAGSLWDSLADIIDDPSQILEILGESLPEVVGYFISLLLTKILAGLPLVLLRTGALSRYLFLRSVYNERLLTQNELDSVYKPQYLKYGWEYPTQLLVIMICFTYACISPIILPVAAVFFAFALVVYKKQLLYVYEPAYQSGGSFLPVVMEETLYGLVLAQLTLLGYTTLRQGEYYLQSLFLLPLPFITLFMVRQFKNEYHFPSENLSMERAVEIDRSYGRLVDVDDDEQKQTTPIITPDVTNDFRADAYRQPVLTEGISLPLPYRQDTPINDEIMMEVDEILQGGGGDGGERPRRRWRIMMDHGEMKVEEEEDGMTAPAAVTTAKEEDGDGNVNERTTLGITETNDV